MNGMRTTGSRKISDTCDGDAYAPQRTAAIGGTSTLGRKMSNSGALPRLRQRNKKSIHILGRIKQMWCDSDFTLTQRDHELLVPQRLI